MAERRSKFCEGFDAAIEASLQVIQIAKLTYPRVPSEEELRLFMDGPPAAKILEAVIEYHVAGSKHIQERVQTAQS